ncbi:predicted protein [Arabidopsis lyrata subsp. lyrata]|uniref:Predicted protein n=1 Tax=Arabidopsis lyrata subsp. lyrata TaxID=81972 RepID=D7M1V7_ARALL|nr:predicted protein [Arabidopsis lyrata subsp. lyrata]
MKRIDKKGRKRESKDQREDFVERVTVDCGGGCGVTEGGGEAGGVGGGDDFAPPLSGMEDLRSAGEK